MNGTQVGVDLAKAVCEVAVSHALGRVQERRRLRLLLPGAEGEVPNSTGADHDCLGTPVCVRMATATPVRIAPS